jgi:hypothetical protein
LPGLLVAEAEARFEFVAIRDRIETAANEWAAAQQALQCQPSAAAGAVDSDGFFGVVGAGRMEFAIAAEEWGQHGAVEVHAED